MMTDFKMKDKLTVKEALYNLKKIFESVDDCCEASMDKPCVLDNLKKIEKYLKEVVKKENPVDLNDPFGGYY